MKALCFIKIGLPTELYFLIEDIITIFVSGTKNMIFLLKGMIATSPVIRLN